MKTRPNPRFVRTEFASFTGAPPYTVTGMRARKGLNRTVFFPTISAFATDVRTRRFPADDESYHLSSETAEALGLYGSATKTA